MPSTDIKTPERVNRARVRLAGQLAYHAGEYENAWRRADDDGMREHLRQLDALCENDASASLIRAACTIAAAITRSSGTAGGYDTSLEHLETAQQREVLITEHLLGLQTVTGAELFSTSG